MSIIHLAVWIVTELCPGTDVTSSISMSGQRTIVPLPFLFLFDWKVTETQWAMNRNKNLVAGVCRCLGSGFIAVSVIIYGVPESILGTVSSLNTRFLFLLRAVTIIVPLCRWGKWDWERSRSPSCSASHHEGQRDKENQLKLVLCRE
jgi:hypothetical protein